MPNICPIKHSEFHCSSNTDMADHREISLCGTCSSLTQSGECYTQLPTPLSECPPLRRCTSDGPGRKLQSGKGGTLRQGNNKNKNEVPEVSQCSRDSRPCTFTGPGHLQRKVSLLQRHLSILSTGYGLEGMASEQNRKPGSQTKCLQESITVFEKSCGEATREGDAPFT